VEEERARLDRRFPVEVGAFCGTVEMAVEFI
jgi:hypothetical protein